MKQKPKKSSVPVLDTAICNVFRDIFTDSQQRAAAIEEAQRAYAFIKNNNDFKTFSYGRF